MGALFEVHLAGEGYDHLVGQTVWLRWTDDPLANTRFWGVTQGVIFDKDAHADAAKGVVLPRAGRTTCPWSTPSSCSPRRSPRTR